MGVGSWQFELPSGKGFWGSETYRFFGVAAKDVPAPALDAFTQFVHPDDTERIQRWLADCAAGAVMPSIEFRTRPQNGNARWLRSFGVLEKSSTGSPLRITGVFEEITEAQRLAGQVDFRAMFEQAAVGIVQAEAGTGRFLQVNQRFADMLGYSKQELLRMTSRDVTHPDDLNVGAEQMAELLAGEIKECSIEKRYLRKDGTTVWGRISASRTTSEEKNKPALLTGLIEDISQRKESEFLAEETLEKWRRLIDILPVGVTILDANRRVLDVNPAIMGMLEMTQEKMAIGAYSARKYISADGSPMTIDDFASHRALTTQEIVEHVETGVIKENGETTWLDVSAAPLPFKDAACVVVSVDITHRKKSEETIRRTQKMEAMGQLTGGIAHDFNNQLGIILGSVELLETAGGMDAQTGKRIQGIRTAAERAAQLTRQLLGFARGKPARTTLVDVSQRLMAMENLISRSLTAAISVVYEFDSALWPTSIDGGDFEDAMLNLLLNARDAMPAGGSVRVEALNWVLDAAYGAANPGVTPGEYVQVSITDSGEGIPREIVPRIFEPFFTTRAHGAGTGLGLAMVFGFVRRSNGHIAVYSEEGVGSTFRMYLPRAKGALPLPPEMPLPIPEMPRGKETLLVAEDEEGLLALAEETLVALGYKVITAKKGDEALQKLSTEPAISLLFTDVVMPGGMNGYELAEEVRRRSPGIKILITSGYAGKRAEKSGTDFPMISKPYRQSDLAVRVRALLDKPAH